MTTACLRSGLALWLVLAGAAPGWAQALPNLSLLRVRFNTARVNARPEGELKAALEAIDREVAEALRHGRTGEVRRLLAKGMTLVDGRPL